MSATHQWQRAAAIFAVWSAGVAGQGYRDGVNPAEAVVKVAKPNGSTPRTADGKPDLSGMYTAGAHMFNFGNDPLFPDRSAMNSWQASPVQYNGPECKECGGGEPAQALLDRAMINKPIYKPEYWQRVQDFDFGLVTDDPQYTCIPQGVPRMGIPLKIVQTPKEVILWHLSYPWGYRVRTIPIDGRKHKSEDKDALTFDGIPVGRWDGDTLVIESVGFNDETWLGWPGYIHSNQITVTERIWRNGDLLYWQATVADPVMLQEPWVMDPQIRRLNPDPSDSVLEESLPCEEQDGQILLKVAPRYRG